MGNSQKKELEEDQTGHERLGYVRLEQKPTDPQGQDDEQESYVMHLTRTVESEKVFSEWQKSMNQIDDSQSKEVILLPLKHSFEKAGLCSSGGIAQLSYDYYEFVLKTEILNRNKLKKDFLQTEVWYLLYNIVRAGHKFELLRKKIGNIHPTNILINESGQIKIISTSSLPGELNNYDTFLERQNESNVPVFLAPEEINLDLIQKGLYPSHVDPSLAEVFSIGLTILSSGTLEDADSVYRYSPYEIRKDRLAALLRTFKEKYSDFLFQTVASMVALNPQDRKRCSTISSSLNEYEPQILDLEPFQVQNFRAPQRVSNTYQAQPYQPQQPQVVSQVPLYYGSQQQPVQRYTQVPSQNYPPYQQSIPVYHRSQI